MRDLLRRAVVRDLSEESCSERFAETQTVLSSFAQPYSRNWNKFTLH